MRRFGIGIVVGFALGALVMLVPVALAQGVPPLQELIPLPGPGQPQPAPGPQLGQEECPVILFYHNGQLYRLTPGPGPQDGRGQPGSPPEFFYLNPYQGPAIPGLPQPFSPFPQSPGPNFRPARPRS